MFLPTTRIIEAVNAPIWAPMSGTDGSTIFTQDGTDSMTFTRVGTPTISTTQQKWGNGSGSFSYNNYIYGTYGGAWSAVWTIEFWFYGSFSSSNGMLSVGKGYDGSGRTLKMTIRNIITGAVFSHTFTDSQIPSHTRNIVMVVNRSNRNTGVGTNIRFSKWHQTKYLY